MLTKLKTFITVSLMGLFVAVPFMVPAAAYACSNTVSTGIEQGVTAATQAPGATPSCDLSTSSNSGITGGIETLARTAINVFSIIVGVIAVVMIIYGGFRYITSGGDSGKVGNAKNTLIYAIIGLVIVALAQLIVHYVLTTANGIK